MHTHIRSRRALPFKWIFRHCSSPCLDAPDEPQPQVSNEVEREIGKEEVRERLFLLCCSCLMRCLLGCQEPLQKLLLLSFCIFHLHLLRPCLQ